MGYVANVEVSNITADAIVAPKISGEEKSALGEAKTFLEVFLANGGMNAAEVKKAATSEGISEATLQRAKNQLGIQSKRVNDQNGKVHNWEWSLSDDKSPLSKKDDEYLDYIDINAGRTSYSPHNQSEDDEHVDFTSTYIIKDHFRTSSSLVEAKLPLKNDDEHLEHVDFTSTFDIKNQFLEPGAHPISFKEPEPQPESEPVSEYSTCKQCSRKLFTPKSKESELCWRCERDNQTEPDDQDNSSTEGERGDNNDESTNIIEKVETHKLDDSLIYDDSYFLDDEPEPRDLLDSELPEDRPNYGTTKLLKTYSDGSPFCGDNDIDCLESCEYE